MRKGFAFLLFLLPACTRLGGDVKTQIVAKVNGDPVYARELLSSLEQLRSDQDETSLKNPRIQDQLKSRAINEAIIMSLVRQQAVKNQIRVPREEVESRLASWKDGYPPGGFEEMLRKKNTTEDFLKRRIEDQLLIEKVIATLFGSETLVSDDEMKTYYNSHQREFYRPERIHALQIVVPTVEEAEKIRQEIASNKLTFESAARQFSLSPDAAKGGDLGFFSKGEKISAFDSAFSLSVGSISKPISSQYGTHLVKVLEKQPSQKLDFTSAKNSIVKVLRQSKESKVYKEWLTKLLKDAEIERNEKLFADI